MSNSPVFNILSGLRVVDLSQNMAGPFCTQILADFGAEVLKVEPPGGDPARLWGPPFVGTDSALFLSANRGKKSVGLDLKTDEGVTALWSLIDEADVFVEAFRTGTIEKLGFGREAVRARRPSILYVSVSAYGRTGPGADLAGYDPLVQAYSGLVENTGHADGAPARVGGSVNDLGTGMWAAMGVMAALRQRDQTGEGSVIDASLLDTSLNWMCYHLTGYLSAGHAPTRMGTSLALIAPYGGFPTSDGQLMLAAPNDGLFHRLCDALELPELKGEPNYRHNPDRVANRESLNGAIRHKTLQYTVESLFARLREFGVPSAPIQSVEEVVRDEQVLESEMLRPSPHPGRSEHWETVLPLRFDGARLPPRTPPPFRPGDP